MVIFNSYVKLPEGNRWPFSHEKSPISDTLHKKVPKGRGVDGKGTSSADTFLCQHLGRLSLYSHQIIETLRLSSLHPIIHIYHIYHIYIILYYIILYYIILYYIILYYIILYIYHIYISYIYIIYIYISYIYIYHIYHIYHIYICIHLPIETVRKCIWSCWAPSLGESSFISVDPTLSWGWLVSPCESPKTVWNIYIYTHTCYVYIYTHTYHVLIDALYIYIIIVIYIWLHVICYICIRVCRYLYVYVYKWMSPLLLRNTLFYRSDLRKAPLRDYPWVGPGWSR